jgi:hypothetical protein
MLLGFYDGVVGVYCSFGLIVAMGFWLRSRRRRLTIIAASLVGSVVFFVSTNFFLWCAGVLYPMTSAGLMECFVVAIPFFQGTVAGDLCYTAVLFGGYAWIEKAFPVMRERPIVIA